MTSELLQKARDYEEKYGAFIQPEDRPGFHLSPRVGWMNDPNGFSLYQGKYHLFYQYHPYSNTWGPMHWGHAVSEDLLHWTYLPAAMAPDMPYDKAGCFSGSAIDYGIDFYAPQTVVSPDGRRIMIGWLQNWDTCVSHPVGAKWFGQMSVPRELHLRDGRLIQNPIRELEALRGRRIVYHDVRIQEETVLKGVYGRMVDMTVTVKPTADNSYELFRIKFARGSQHYSSISYRPASSTLRISRKHSGFNRDFVHDRQALARDRRGEIKLRVILDRFSAEVFINDGEQAMSMTIYTPETADGISFEAHGSVFLSVEKYELLP